MWFQNDPLGSAPESAQFEISDEKALKKKST